MEAVAAGRLGVLASWGPVRVQRSVMKLRAEPATGSHE
ncbi:hypothetical protein BRCON_0996 [Candidatus Sumerlaea chitinivorans]|uniref:Uncharacterized protein n=1 Tax=Sumerlaea chitinivorans TaxID=2250252 RepID=A0A2Z4Y5I2_SUMC1|nr:hypothetical protein BRCON_0996 [Candidatus Sumerlaea chitinivorans]